MNSFEPALWSAAFVAGLLGSGHCFAMCGGIAGSLGAMAVGRTASIRSAVDFNLGRLLSYMLLGALAGGLVGFTGKVVQLQSVGQWLRLATATLVALVGMRFLFNWSGLDIIERGGALVWKRILPLAIKAGHRKDWAGRFALGLCWGFLPCGLVYTLLLTAASTGVASGGAATMLAFGLGTLPAMLGLTLAAPGLSVLLADRGFRRCIGFSLLALSVWMIITIAFPVMSGHAHHAG